MLRSYQHFNSSSFCCCQRFSIQRSSQSTFFYFLTSFPNWRFLNLTLFALTFFYFWRFVPVNIFSLWPFVKVGDFSILVMSHPTLFLLTFCPSTFFTIGVFLLRRFVSLSVNLLSYWEEIFFKSWRRFGIFS
jgi:hypothetical protein